MLTDLSSTSTLIVRSYDCDRFLVRGWPRHPKTNHLMQWTTRSMLLGGERWASWQTHVVMARTVGCYQLQDNCVMWKDFTIHMKQSPMYQWVDTQQQWYMTKALYISSSWMRHYCEKSTEHSLVNPNQIRSFGIPVNDNLFNRDQEFEIYHKNCSYHSRRTEQHYFLTPMYRHNMR